MLIIFDIDGTLCDTHEVEARCYVEAIRAVTGLTLTTVDWSKYPEATSSAVVHDFLGEKGITGIAAKEISIRDEFVRQLNREWQREPDSFRPMPGALELFTTLRSHPAYRIAIATGCWQESGKLKLHHCGFAADGIPFASSSDTRRRPDIIRTAAERAGVPVESAVYVGDGPWDLKATRELGMPFIGVGKRHARLRELGAAAVLEDFRDPRRFFHFLSSPPAA